MVPTYLALGSAVLLFALVLSRMKFPKIASEHEGETGGQGSFRRTAALSAVVVCGGGECVQCGRADRHVEQPDPVYEAVHAGDASGRRHTI